MEAFIRFFWGEEGVLMKGMACAISFALFMERNRQEGV
jgi:hypothetical protein